MDTLWLQDKSRGAAVINSISQGQVRAKDPKAEVTERRGLEEPQITSGLKCTTDSVVSKKSEVEFELGTRTIPCHSVPSV